MVGDAGAAREEATQERGEGEAEAQAAGPADAGAGRTAALERAGSQCPGTGEGGDTLAWPASERTARMPQAAVREEPAASAASLRDVREVAESFARGRAGAAGVALRRHPVAVALAAVAAVGVALAVILASLWAAELPTTEQAEADARELAETPGYSGGTFGLAEALVVTDARTLERRAEGGGRAEATVAMGWSNGGVEAEADVTLSYRREGDGWTCEGAQTGRAAFEAARGVDAARLEGDTAARAELLRRAEAAWQAGGAAGGVGGGDVAQTSLATLYRDAEARVTRTDFDVAAQTDAVVLHLSAEETFTSYEADVTASFAFRPGTGEWELVSAEAGAGAKDVGYAPLVGTWHGTFSAQGASGAGKCFGARDAQVELVVAQADGTRVAGSVSGVAHFHGELEADAAGDAGDQELARVAFEGTRVAGAAGIAFDCALAEVASGELGLRLDFGSAERPDAATATLTSRHEFDAMLLFLPYRREARFADTFALTKE